MAAPGRTFANDELKPLSLARDRIADPREAFDWDIIRKGSQLGFRTLAMLKEYGGYRAEMVTQAVVMADSHAATTPSARPSASAGSGVS